MVMAPRIQPSLTTIDFIKQFDPLIGWLVQNSHNFEALLTEFISQRNFRDFALRYKQSKCSTQKKTSALASF